MLTILSTEYGTKHNVLEVYVAGCSRKCKGCHNPEAQAFGVGRPWPLWLRDNTYKLKNDLVNHVWILGGDLLCHPVLDVVEFLRALKKQLPGTTRLWLWTGAETLKAVPKKVRAYCDYIKTGSYKEDSETYVVTTGTGIAIQLASRNQHLWAKHHGTGDFYEPELYFFDS